MGEARTPRLQLVLGQNQLQGSLYDATTGGCRDGLHADRVNENQGAESTLSFSSPPEMRAADRAAAMESTVPENAISFPSSLGGMNGSASALRHDCEPGYETSSSTPDQSNSHGRDWPYPAHSVFNAGATRLQTARPSCYAASKTGGFSHLCAARSAKRLDGW